ncbi:NUDIX domain-containing protein [Dyella sp. ASV21]|uniref:NUDIX hydrolase n=1 Tax=Dyella sp. ASV21 TaxID=2795114 RepID=UPI0018EBE745|nr:NUDIX domain-containing protein [Dyella sp. ASV21]
MSAPAPGEVPIVRRTHAAFGVSVFVVVHEAQRILLLQRAGTGWMDGYLSLPAGRHDGGETLHAAAARELREETGLEADTQRLRLIHLLHCEAGDHGKEWMGAFFLAERWRGTPRIAEPEKHDQLIWSAPDALPANTIPYVRQALEQGLAGLPYSHYGWT